MSQYDELKRLAINCRTERCADEDEQARNERDFLLEVDPEEILALIAENERLLKLLERTAEQYVPLTELEGVPGWSRVVKLDEVCAERDQLRAENAGLRTGYQAYERVNAELKAEVEGLREGNDKLTRRNGMLEQNVEVMTEAYVPYTWLRKKCDQPSNDDVVVHMNIGHTWALVRDLDRDLRTMIDREEP